MKDYIKPTFTLAGLFPVALAAGGCSIDNDTKESLIDVWGIEDWSKAFFDTADQCHEETLIEGYCKFTHNDVFGTGLVVIGS